MRRANQDSAFADINQFTRKMDARPEEAATIVRFGLIRFASLPVIQVLTRSLER